MLQQNKKKKRKQNLHRRSASPNLHGGGERRILRSWPAGSQLTSRMMESGWWGCDGRTRRINNVERGTSSAHAQLGPAVGEWVVVSWGSQRGPASSIGWLVKEVNEIKKNEEFRLMMEASRRARVWLFFFRTAPRMNMKKIWIWSWWRLWGSVRQDTYPSASYSWTVAKSWTTSSLFGKLTEMWEWQIMNIS